MFFSTLLLLLHLCAAVRAVLYFNLTAISAVKGESVIQCWQLLDPVAVSSQAGIAGAALQQLGNIANASYAVIPPRFNGGPHVAPFVQYVLFSSGQAHVTLPCSKDEAVIQGGKYGLILAADVASVSVKGHITQYPSNEQTTALALPTAGGKLPRHKVLHSGACSLSELDF